ncbi:uncharacterized protein LOC111040962, partial [Myzus persicae]|uniref:uncharacterized protein LOC111040962 n=1 Tax=Myzus persicae TaxID=13164 RepID=UPI000B936890
MASMIIILISITLIVAFTGEAFNVDSDTEWNNDHINKLSLTLSRSKFQTMIVPEYNGLDMWTMLQLRPRLDPVDSPQTVSPTETDTAKPLTGQHGASLRNRRQAIDKIKGGDGGSSSILSLTSSGSPSIVNGEDSNPMSVKNFILGRMKLVKMNQIQKSKFRNRRRRSASDKEISSEKNITSTADPMIDSNGHNMSAVKCLLSLSFPVSLPTDCIQFYFRSLF